VHAAGAKSVEEFFSTMSRQLTEHEWTIVKSAGDEHRQLATFYRHWVQTCVVLRQFEGEVVTVSTSMFFVNSMTRIQVFCQLYTIPKFDSFFIFVAIIIRHLLT